MDLFDIKGLIWNGIVNKRFQAVVFVKLLREPKYSEFLKDEKYKINLVQKNPVFDLLEEIRKKTLSQIEIQLIFRNEAYIP